METLFKKYIELIYKMLALSKDPAELEREKSYLISDTEKYKNKLSIFENQLDTFPALKQELFDNFSEFKVGAFFEYQLDLLVPKLQEIAQLKTEIEQQITDLKQNYPTETKDWLPEKEYQITAADQYLISTNVQIMIDFLNHCLKTLQENMKSYESEKSKPNKTPYINNEDSEKIRRQQENEIKRKKAQELFQKQLHKNKK